MIKNNNYTYIGNVKRQHGISGEVVISVPDNDLADLFENSELIFIEIDGRLVPFFVSEDGIRSKNSTDYIVKLDYIDKQEDTHDILCQKVFIETSINSLSLKSQLQSEEITGFSITDKEHGELGTLKNIIEYPMNMVLEIDFKGQELLIPVNENVILNIDYSNKVILVNLPDGLIDLYQ